MASQPVVQVSSEDSSLRLLLDSFPNLNLTTQTSESAPSKLVLSDNETISGSNTIIAHLSSRVFPNIAYTELEQQQINQWLTLSATQLSTEAETFLESLNEHLKTRTTVLGDKFSVADVAIYTRLRDIASKWTPEQSTGGEKGGYRYIVRFLDFVQNSPKLGLKVTDEEKIKVDPANVITKVRVAEPKKEKKGDAKGKAADAAAKVEGTAKEVVDKAKDAVAAAAGQVGATDKKAKKEKAKKEKKEKAPAPKKEEAPLSPSQLDLRVGKIIKCVPHPEADGLYVSTISALDPADSPYITALPTPYCPAELIPEGTTVRTVCSGLRKYIPIEEMQNRKVVLVANLKPANLRGIKSQAMVLAASPKEGEKDIVELVNPPEGAEVGDRLVFEGFEEGEPEPQLNPKKKIMETLTPGLGTDANKVVTFNGSLVKELGKESTGRLILKSKGVEGGFCTVQTLSNALVK